MTKLSMAVAAVSFAVSFVCAFSQAERIKGKVKDLKKQGESGAGDKPASMGTGADSK